MKSMSIVAHGMSRLYCVCRCATGLRSCLRPLIHIFDGENVWHQVMRPMHSGALFASWQSAVMSSGVVITGLKTTLTGIAGAIFSAPAISCECFGDGLEGFRAVEMLAAGDKPDFELFQFKHKSFPFRVPIRRATKTIIKTVLHFRWSEAADKLTHKTQAPPES